MPSDVPAYSAVEQQDATSTEDTNLAEKIPTKNNLKRLVNFGWWWEVYAVALAIASTAAIVAVLLKVDAKPITSWSHSIQPASLVAIFSTIAKSALLVPTAVCLSQLKWSHFERPRSLAHMQYFDDASRGPWGALLFLWKTRGTALLASVGALTVVLMTTFETFSQQAIHLTSKSVLLRNETGFVVYNQDFSDEQFAYGAVLSADVRLEFTIAMMSAMTGKPSPYSASQSYCPTYECHFDDFVSLGACTQCLTEVVEVNDRDFDCTYHTFYNELTVGTDQRQSYTTLPSFKQAVIRDFGHNLSSYGMDCSQEKKGYPTFNINLEVATGNGTNNNGTYLLQGLGSPQGSTNATGLSTDAVFGNTYLSFNGTNWMTSIKGWSMRYCASGYKRDFGGNNGDFDTIDTFTCIMTPFILEGLQNLDTFGTFKANMTRCRLSLCAQEFKDLIMRNNSLTFGSVTEKPLTSVGLNSYKDVKATADGFQGSFLIGPLSTGNIAQNIETVVYSEDFKKFLTQVTTDDRYGSWEPAFRNISQVVTEYMRGPAVAGYRSQRPGLAYGPEPFFQVRWAWLVVPLLLVVMSVVFLIGTAVYSRRKPYLFKNSVLAALLYGLSGREVVGPHEPGSRETDDDLAKLVTGVKATLMSDGNGQLRFVRQQ